MSGGWAPSFVAAVCAVIFGTGSAAAHCERYPTPDEEFAEADYVFIGQVTAARLDRPEAPELFDGIEYTVEPLKAFKGDVPSSIMIYSENSSGRFPMHVSGWYILFVGRPYDAGFQQPSRRERAVNSCGNSFPLNVAPMALQAAPSELTFNEVMALSPER